MISPGFILFGRNKFDRPASPWKVILYDRTNFTFNTLGKESYACFCIFPGVVTDDFATWTDCAGAVCQAYYYDIANTTPHKIPNPLHAQQYDASVNGSGTELYYVRSGNGCGIRVKIMRWTIGGGSDPVVVSALPAGYDVAQHTFTYTDVLSHDQVYFDRARCSKTYPSDLYVVQDADTALTAAATVGATAAPGIRGQKASQFVGPDSGAR
jgi:hypothetical protein